MSAKKQKQQTQQIHNTAGCFLFFFLCVCLVCCRDCDARITNTSSFPTPVLCWDTVWTAWGICAKLYLWLILIVQQFSRSGSYRSHCLTPRCGNLWPESSCVTKMLQIVFPRLSGLLINGSMKVPNCFTSSEMYLVWPFQDTHHRPEGDYTICSGSGIQNRCVMEDILQLHTPHLMEWGN